jgi:hypothetical protein
MKKFDNRMDPIMYIFFLQKMFQMKKYLAMRNFSLVSTLILLRFKLSTTL